MVRTNHLMSLQDVRSRMCYAADEPHEFHYFLDKFRILDDIQWDEQSLIEVIHQVCWDLVREHIDYCELKFSVDKFVRQMGWSPQAVIKFVYQHMNEECSRWGILVPLVLSLKYESDPENQRRTAKLIEDPEIANMLAGIDLVGAEACFNVNLDLYMQIFKQWRDAGKGTMAHVGETQSARNVRIAIEKLGVKRIAHGIRILEDPEIVALARERDICFDIALTSNVYTGVVSDYKNHPVQRMLEAGLKITIGTDDPAILNTTLDNEYKILMDTFKLSDECVLGIMDNSLRYAFIGRGLCQHA